MVVSPKKRRGETACTGTLTINGIKTGKQAASAKGKELLPRWFIDVGSGGEEIFSLTKLIVERSQNNVLSCIIYWFLIVLRGCVPITTSFNFK